MPVLVATFAPDAEKFDAVEAVLREMVPEVQREEGCEMYALHRGRDCLVLIEKWTDVDALKAHGSGENVQELNRRLYGLMDTPPSIQRLESVPIGDAAKGTL